MASVRSSSGGIRPSRYAPVEVPSEGARENGRSVLHAPPTVALSSSTVTERPARASSTAATRPLWPAPMIRTSVCTSTPIAEHEEREEAEVRVVGAADGEVERPGRARQPQAGRDHQAVELVGLPPE